MEVVIVESPAKAKTINKYLGPNYVVLASYGHVRDLPPRDGSVETDNGFAMHWELYADKARQLKAISDEVKKADRVILATDPDREGEAIAWHLLEWMTAKKGLLPKGGATRVTFNEITKPAILAAMGRPRDVDGDLVDAYRARRALDYLVGFNLSPVLWRKLPGAKSAGRVQSVALRIVVDREREIETFVNREYWTVEATLATVAGTSFVARLTHWNGKKLDRFDLNEVVAAQQARADVEARQVHRQRGRDQAGHAQPLPAVHHLDAAAGGGAQARLHREPHDARRPVALRGRPHHLHADRRRPGRRRGDRRRARRHRRGLRRRRARPAQDPAPLCDQGQERAGSA